MAAIDEATVLSGGSPPRRRLRHTVVSLLIAVITVTSAEIVLARPAAAGGGGCAPAEFVGARGSGEAGPGTPGWSWGASASDPYGLGGPVAGAYSRILRGYYISAVYSVQYAADPVPQHWWSLSDWKKYFRDLDAGVTQAVNDLTSDATICPNSEIVLAGYSQGAMLMHRVVHELSATTGGRQILSRVAATILIADGDQVPYDHVTRYGTAPMSAHGVGQAFRTLSHSSTTKFSSDMSFRVLSVCTNHDPVCASTDTNLRVVTNPGLARALSGIHSQYDGATPPLSDAADRATILLRAALGV